MAKININAEELVNKLKPIILKASIETAYEVRDEIKQSMVNSPEWSEKTYYRKGGRKHHPSHPGNPPRVDYGVLHDSISVNWEGSGMSYGEVGSRAKSSDGVGQPTREGEVLIGTNVKAKDGNPLWLYLEGGTAKMKKRPFLLGAVKKYKNIIANILNKLAIKYKLK